MHIYIYDVNMSVRTGIWTYLYAHICAYITMILCQYVCKDRYLTIFMCSVYIFWYYVCKNKYLEKNIYADICIYIMSICV